ncbi:hypothetical protein ES703_76631 [subsurface metagenome]
MEKKNKWNGTFFKYNQINYIMKKTKKWRLEIYDDKWQKKR